MGFILVARLLVWLANGCTWLAPKRNAELTKGNVWQCICTCTIGPTFVCRIGVANVVRRKCVKMSGTDACFGEQKNCSNAVSSFWHVLLVGNVLANCCPNRVWETAIRKHDRD